MTAGIAPQSSWIFRPRQPASICSSSERGLARSCRARESRNSSASASAACSILPTLKAPPQSMPTVIGPSEPPIMVVMPEAMACSHELALSKCTCTSMPPGVAISPSASRTVVAAPTIRFGIDPVHHRRVARLADADDLAVLDADVALDDAEHRIDHQRVAEQHVERAHGAVIARRPGRCRRAASCRRRAGTRRPARHSRARPRRVSEVSPSRTASPVVGPYMRGVVLAA